MMKLADTVEGMNSMDYKERFMVKGENTRHFSDGMNRHMVSIL